MAAWGGIVVFVFVVGGADWAAIWDWLRDLSAD